MIEQRYWVRWLPWLLVLAGFTVYFNTLPNSFVFDDTPHIVNGEAIRSFSTTFESMSTDSRPLVLLSLAMNYAIDGLETRGYHLFNMLIHLFAGLALFGIVHRTLRLPHWKNQYDNSAPWFAFVIALLWLVHPLNTQSVAYVIQRAESMMGLFFLLSLYAAIRQWHAETTSKQIAWTLLAVATAFLGAMSKQVMVGLPLVVLLYDWVFVRSTWRVWLKQRAALLGGLMAVSVYLFWRSRGIMSEEGSSAGFEMPVVDSLGYLITQPGVILHYLRLSFWPHPLILDYQWLPAVPFDTPDEEKWRLIRERVLPFAIPLTGLFIASVAGAWRRCWWGFCGLSFFIILAPTSSVLPIADMIFEHRMYLPLICVVSLAVCLMVKVLRWIAPNGWLISAWIVIGVVAIMLSATTMLRNSDYQTKISIWDSVVFHEPTNPRAWHNLAAALYEVERYDESLACYEQTLAILPTYAAAHAGIGDIYLLRKKPIEAISHYQRAVELSPEKPSYHYDLGRAWLRMGQFSDAEQSLNRAIELKPDYPKAYNNLGIAYGQLDRFDDAIKALKQARTLDPDGIDSLRNIAITYERMGQPAKALDAVKQGLTLTKKNDEVDSALTQWFVDRERKLSGQANQAPALP